MYKKHSTRPNMAEKENCLDAFQAIEPQSVLIKTAIQNFLLEYPYVIIFGYPWLFAIVANSVIIGLASAQVTMICVGSHRK